jgi:hypothetical protein
LCYWLPSFVWFGLYKLWGRKLKRNKRILIDSLSEQISSFPIVLSIKVCYFLIWINMTFCIDNYGWPIISSLFNKYCQGQTITLFLR